MGSSSAALRLALLRLHIPPPPPPSLHSLKLSSPFPSSSSLSTLTKANPYRLFCSSSSSPSIVVEELGIEEVEETSDTGDEVTQHLPTLRSPKLSVKERKELASYAHSLGKKLKSQQVGKSGVTPSVAASFVENLESNELLKLKIHGSCPGELIDVIKQLEESTGSTAIDQIGRSVILYRPSQSKMKKREAASLRKAKEHSAIKMQKKRQAPRVT